MRKFAIGILVSTLLAVAGWSSFPKNGLAVLLDSKARLSETLTRLEWQTGSPVYLRIFKQESELELYGRHGGRLTLLKTYPICNWSGRLGPKYREGDLQSPEGFYTVGFRQLNPNSTYHRSFNLGFPNAVEQAQGRTGSYLMVHGNCVSIGCYAMTDNGIEEIYNIVKDAIETGQANVPVHAFPFRMNDAALDARKGHPEFKFWRTLKPAYDLFEKTGTPPAVFACGDAYRVAEAGTEISEDCRPLQES